MSHGKLTIISILACFILCTGAFLSYYFLKNTVVSYNGTSFTPQTVTIKEGQTVVFKNKSNEEFWPASNLHPSHLIWTEFDPKKPIGVGGSWNFTFTKTGNWNYHNHIKPIHGGIVKVLDAKGNEVNALDCSQDIYKQQCWENEIQEVLDTGDMSNVFTVLSSLYENEPGFKRSCHDMTHKIGAKVYSLFLEEQDIDLSEQTSYCGYGFFHGFMEELLAKSGDINEARLFCTFINEELSDKSTHSWDACYHGIGHGLIDGGDPRTWGNVQNMLRPALEMCEQVATNTNQLQQCGSGVFNSIAVALSEHNYRLSVETEHVYDLCTSVEKYEFKYACYEQMNPLVGELAGNDIAATFTLVNTITEEEFKGVAMRSAAGSFAHEDMTTSDYERVINECYLIPQPLRERCIAGFTTKLMEFGPLGDEYILGIHFCKSKNLQSTEQKQCFESVIKFIEPAETKTLVCKNISSYVDSSTLQECVPGG